MVPAAAAAAAALLRRRRIVGGFAAGAGCLHALEVFLPEAEIAGDRFTADIAFAKAKNEPEPRGQRASESGKRKLRKESPSTG